MGRGGVGWGEGGRRRWSAQDGVAPFLPHRCLTTTSHPSPPQATATPASHGAPAPDSSPPCTPSHPPSAHSSPGDVDPGAFDHVNQVVHVIVLSTEHREGRRMQTENSQLIVFQVPGQSGRPRHGPEHREGRGEAPGVGGVPGQRRDIGNKSRPALPWTPKRRQMPYVNAWRFATGNLATHPLQRAQQAPG